MHATCCVFFFFFVVSFECVGFCVYLCANDVGNFTLLGGARITTSMCLCDFLSSGLMCVCMRDLCQSSNTYNVYLLLSICRMCYLQVNFFCSTVLLLLSLLQVFPSIVALISVKIRTRFNVDWISYHQNNRSKYKSVAACANLHQPLSATININKSICHNAITNYLYSLRCRRFSVIFEELFTHGNSN